MMIIFLDIDGVLHPANALADDLFCRRELFESVVHVYPAVRIVISSTWREMMPLSIIREFFSLAIRGRIIDVTPMLANEVSTYWRYEEIRLWIKQNRYEGNWLAVDDAVREFPPELAQLIACDGRHGFDMHAAERLRAALDQIRCDGRSISSIAPDGLSRSVK